MHVIFALFVSLIHFTFCLFIFISVLISNNANVLTFFLILMILTKLCYWMCGQRCVLSIYEKNEYFATTAQVLSKTITNVKLHESDMELILINMIILIILNKLFWLTMLSYYKLPLLQKIIQP
jgi:hypothetical protein